MIDIKKLREQPEVFKKSSLAKNVNVDIDEILRLDSENKKNLSLINELRAKLKSHSKKKPAAPIGRQALTKAAMDSDVPSQFM